MKVKLQVTVIYVLSCILLSLYSGCKKDLVTKHNKLIAHFEGKYRIITAVSDRAVDLNLDGSFSSDLFLELPNLKKAYLDLRIRTEYGRFIYSQLWPNQFVTEMNPSAANPNAYVNFANQATVATFTIDEQETKFNLYRDWTDSNFPLPLSVTVLPNRNLQVLMKKNVYTSNSWTTINIEVEYERFTTQL